MPGLSPSLHTDLLPDGVRVAPLSLPAAPPQPALQHPRVGLQVVVAHLEVTETREGLGSI
jgi:hypothetical protein